jgi:hypothetical protein
LNGTCPDRFWDAALKHSGAKINRESLVNALDALGTYDLGGLNVTYGAKREGAHYVDLTMISRDGLLVH